MRAVLVIALLSTLPACQRKPAEAPAAAQTTAAAGLPAGSTATTADAPAAAPAEATAAVALDGPGLWTKYCALCHGPDAKGYAADNAPSLVSDTFLSTASDDFLRLAIERGRPGTAMVGYAKTWGGPLEPRDVDTLIAFLRKKGKPYQPLPPVSLSGDVQRGKALYDQKCAECHGTPDQRKTAVHLANPLLLQSASDAFLRHAIVHGRPGTPMQAWGDKLKVQEIDDVLAYVRSLAQPPPPPMPPTPKPTGPIVLNPKGKTPEFKLRDERFASLEEVAKALKEKRRIIIVDARAPSDWETLHIEGAISTPYYDKPSLDVVPNDGTWVIAYCACPHHASGEVVDELRRRGYKHTAVLDEGVFAWQRAGHPVVAAPGAIPVPAPPPMVPTPAGK